MASGTAPSFGIVDAQTGHGIKQSKSGLPDCDFAGLLKYHRGHLQERGWRPMECATDLVGVARWMDDYVVAWSA